jgi:hypothetical protein
MVLTCDFGIDKVLMTPKSFPILDKWEKVYMYAVDTFDQKMIEDSFNESHTFSIKI